MQAIQKGNMAQVTHLLDTQPLWTQRRLYHLLSTRLQHHVRRNLVRRVFLVGSSILGSQTFGYTPTSVATTSGGDMDMDGGASTTMAGRPPPRIMLDDVSVAWRVAGGPPLTADAWLMVMARLVDSGLVKGHVLPANRCVVVSRKMAFPPLRPVIHRLIEEEVWWRPQHADRQIMQDGGDDDD